MKIIETNIPDLKIIQPKVFSDDRGFFMESFNHGQFEEIVKRNITFVQDNHSRSNQGVLRGMHYQNSPHEQGKLVRCTYGEVYDVAVDIREHSPTYLQWHGVVLSAENKLQFWIPEGFAHGFLVLSDVAEFMYKTTDYYSPSSEKGFRWDDPDVNIEWPIRGEITLSEKDKMQPRLKP
ncbi:dTDP-4-dehydrorhamnose 3,5-epimerase [Cedecea lapagei]|uniref:dTDP-4-dehydrorhamnose 3,5-epimerase n=1 Tax=Cedecea lapagei TaxID=158823 RepID=A0A447V063_9ENTR|nr:dTDP-4-dehydrorhamnose 3,5-epimerase [Cedecea lapagei]VEB96363.1 dTDP-4-dehydrorhamnose 3,5-epimerase [Cedecea lapagei]